MDVASLRHFYDRFFITERIILENFKAGIIIQISSGTVNGTSSLFFEAVDGGTKFTTAGELDLAYFKLVKMIVNRKINQQIKKDMLKLKDVLENGKRPLCAASC